MRNTPTPKNILQKNKIGKQNAIAGKRWQQ
jgi:hypothetical protein